MTAARRSRGCSHWGRNCRTMWAVIHRTNGGKSFRAQSRPPEAGRRNQRVGRSPSAGLLPRCLLPPLSLPGVVLGRARSWGRVRRQPAVPMRHVRDTGTARATRDPTGRVCNVLARLRSTGDLCAADGVCSPCCSKKRSPTLGNRFLNPSAEHVRGRPLRSGAGPHVESGLPTTTAFRTG